MKQTRPFLMLMLLVALTACAAGGVSSSTNFYTLSPMTMDNPIQPVANAGNLVLGVGPVDLPPRLDRPQIFKLSSRYKVDLNDFEQWAEPLKNNLASVLSENLSTLTGIDKVVLYPWGRPVEVDYQVRLGVVRFDQAPDGTVTLIARWTLLNKDGRNILTMVRSEYKVPGAGAGAEKTVAAMSDALGQLSTEIANKLRSL